MAENPSPFRVVLPERLREQIREWGQRALALGIGREYVDTLNQISQELSARPLDWGDPQYRLRALGLLMFRRLTPIFSVYYGVDEKNRIVYVTDVRVRTGHPLGGGP